MVGDRVRAQERVNDTIRGKKTMYNNKTEMCSGTATIESRRFDREHNN